MVSVPEDNGNVDVLIIGAGPSGLMAADWMARIGVHFRIIDKRASKILNGHADGLSSRTLEIFESCGFLNKILENSVPYYEVVAWAPAPSGIERSGTHDDTMHGLSRFPQHILGQSYIESAFLENIQKNSNVHVERGTVPISVSIEENKINDSLAYPVTITLQQLDEREAPAQEQRGHVADSEGGFPATHTERAQLARYASEDIISNTTARTETQETVHAKYVIACDGAHSWMRKQLGFKMEGERSDYVWGVLDIIPVTDFPDIRRCCMVQSKSGSMLIIPREKRLVRIYTQMLEVKPDISGSIPDSSQLSPSSILAAARRILAPYNIDYTYCDWWTGYQIGQRVSTMFNDPHKRIFLAGDAVHTHSPNAGQGMNTSLQDTFNLGWKIGGVVQGKYRTDILDTYQFERRAIAQQLISFDHRLTRIFSGGATAKELEEIYQVNKLFVHGIGIIYKPSILTSESSYHTDIGQQILGMEASYSVEDDAGDSNSTKNLTPNARGTGHTTKGHVARSHLATGLQVGMRIPSYQVLGQADARPRHLQELLIADGRWRLIVFGGDICDKAQMQRVYRLGEQLGENGSFLSQHQSSTAKGVPASDVDVLLLHAGDRQKVRLADFHKTFFSFDGRWGYDYDKVFVDTPFLGLGGGEAYDGCGVDKLRGCMVLVRPDGYISWIGELEDAEDLNKFFAGFTAC